MIYFVNLSELVLKGDFGAVLEEIVKEVEATNARIVVVDSFRTVVRRAQTSAIEMELQGFVQRLALHLTSSQATTFLVGEYIADECMTIRCLRFPMGCAPVTWGAKLSPS